MKTAATALRPLSLVLCAAAVGALLAAPAHAWWQDDEPLRWATGQVVDVQVQVAGTGAPLYVSPNEDGRHYVQAFAGRNYSLVLRNRTGQRVGVLIAVDGLNVVNGERSQLSGREPMYVLGPWETTTIQGWRTSLSDVRRFVFVDERRSYAERTGQANGDLGWIRVLAFREQQLAWTPVRRWIEGQGGGDRRDRAEEAPRAQLEGHNAPQAAPAMPAPTANGNAAPPAAAGEMKATRRQTGSSDQLGARDGSGFPGTGWGDHRSDPVQRVEFTAERCATDTHVFRYEYASGLRALGILPIRPDPDRLRDRDNGQLGFAKSPRW